MTLAFNSLVNLQVNCRNGGDMNSSLLCDSLYSFKLTIDCPVPVVIAATATANRLIGAIVFKLVTDDLFLTHIRSCPVFLKRELYLSHWK